MTATAEQEKSVSWVAVFMQSKWSLALLFALCGYITVSGCLTAPLIQLDDTIYITDNPLLKPDTPWQRLVTEPTYYQRIPVTMVSYRLNAALFGLETAWAYRLVNLFFHAASALLLLLFLEQLGLGRRAALFAVALWAVHPMACESVAWVSQRRNVLGFFFGMLALYGYARWSGRVLGFILPALAFALALFSSPLAVGWLPIFVALEVLGGAGVLACPEQRWRFRPTLQAVLRLLPLLLLSAVALWVGMSGYARTMRPPPGGTVFTALLTDTDIFLHYLRNTFLPVGLSAMYGVDAIESLADLRLWANVAVWVVLIGGSIWVGRSRGRTVFGWLWFLGGLGPACNVIAIGYPMQDRYMYLSSVGLLLVLVESAAGVARRWPGVDRPWLQAVLPVPCVLLFSLAAADRSADWSDSMVLMRRAVEAQPEAALSHIFYARQLGREAKELRNTGQDEAARESGRQAVQHLEKGLSLPDAYLFTPLFAQMLLAENLVNAGEAKRAIETLEGHLPAPHAPMTEFSGGPACFTYVGSRFEFVYTPSRETLSSGYHTLATAYLHEFLDRPLPPDEAKLLLRSASTNCVNALKILTGSPENQCLRACILLAEESLARKDVSREEALTEARARARMTEPELGILSGIDEVREDLKQQPSVARIRALGCLGMARARFEPLLNGSVPPAEIRQRFEDAIGWAQRAGELDPTLGAGFSYLSRIQYFLYKAAQARNDAALMERQRQACMAALEKVPIDSACYPAAQKNLQTLSANSSPSPRH